MHEKVFRTAEETDKLLCVNVVCVMMLTSSVSCVNHSPVNDHSVRRSAMCCVDVFYLDHWIYIDAITKPIQIDTMCE